MISASRMVEFDECDYRDKTLLWKESCAGGGVQSEHIHRTVCVRFA